MALPQLNDSPKYELTIPSTQQKVRFRPFLVKEEKVMLMAMETENQADILNTITDTIQTCIQDDVNVSKFTTFDVEYCFCLLYTSPSPRDRTRSRMPSSA